MYIHAINAKSRDLFKLQNIAVRQVDGEGDEQEDVLMKGASLIEKFQEAS